RFDFGLLREPSGPPVALFEVKSANLRVGREAWFPDAPTVRGTRHVLELARAARSDIRAGVLFVVQRGDVQAVRPHHRMDPAFADACIEAADVGVHFSAVRLILRPGGASLGARLPVRGLGKAPKMSM
ncbi:MAG: DNA/RNA nuclease SfsA, partial [Thermoplasmata archaeon]|nr:DNA/RNA nuclease SfsA [Thermoplasmata archaeon]